MKVPDLPDGYFWRSIEPFKAVFEHIASGKRYGFQCYGPDPVLMLGGVGKEIAYGVAKIERELARDATHLIKNQDFKS